MIILRIAWSDACHNSTAIMDEDDLVSFGNEDYIVTSVGVLVGINDEAVLITRETHPSDRVRDVLRIPKGYVRTVEVIKVDSESESEARDLSWLSPLLIGDGVRKDGRKRAKRRPTRR